MSDQIRFDGKVAIVTGAGGGLGRSHALALAARGAKVVVNDLGGSAHGEGKSASAADRVVQEIRDAGGDACASYDSVEDGAKIVQCALDSFGRIDIVVNNAGILRDVSFHKMTDADWDLVYRVHVKGSFAVTHAAWPHLRDQSYGRIVMTASAAGIYGNFGQANYAMAKLGLVGFANTLAVEGKKKNVLVNTIAPIAGSRLTETVLPKEVTDALRPEYVSPLVVWLCHDSCEETGGLFEVGGGFFGKLRWERAVGKLYRIGREVRPEDLRAHWSAIAGFEKSTHPVAINESMQPIMENLQRGPSKGGSALIDVDEALGYEYPESKSSYNEKDLALYALGVGATAQNPLDDRELALVYEMSGSGFRALPTFGVIPALDVIIERAKRGESAPGLHYGFDRVLHGEHYLELSRPLPPHASLTHKARIKEIYDKGKNALVITEIETFDEDGDRLALNQLTAFVRGAGGWGGDRGPSAEVNVPPDRAPDRVIEEKIPENQALLYRLTGDVNPLHADPSFAKAFGFDRPILHGLCSFGYAARHVLSAYAKDGDVRFFKSIKVRFAKNVFPGETLVTEMWKENDQRIVFRARIKERPEEIAISHAAIELFEQIPKKAAKKAEAKAETKTEKASESGAIFGAIAAYVEKHPELAAKVQTVFLFKLSAPESAWTIDLKSAPGSVVQGEAGKADCTLEISEQDFLDMSSGKADAQKLYFGGKLKISGNVMASQKLSFLKDVDRSARATVQKGAESAPKAARAPVAEKLFAALAGRKDVIAALGGDKIGFRIQNPDASFVVDPREGSARAGDVQGASATLTLADEDLEALVKKTISAQNLFQRGKLRIDGDVKAARNLDALARLATE
jgi:(3R)-3-hydroxyacyl-CoA dehydrogenase / 3a,7a,12a-trihydroxy-5b-cholest-24-enoyl-CoA hydratase / enoyl-CoA hydratase 2